MVFSFFELPRELRNLIYHHALVSPTGYVMPIICKSVPMAIVSKKSAKQRAKKSFAKDTNSRTITRLHLVPVDPAVTSDSIRCSCGMSDIEGYHHSLPLAYSLPRVSKQFQLETEGLFWNSNTVFFPSSREFPVYIRYMGQTPSRQIKRVRVTVDAYDPDVEMFARSIKKLASRSRLGSLVKLEVAVTSFCKFGRNFGGTSLKSLGNDHARLDAFNRVLYKVDRAGWARDKLTKDLVVDYPETEPNQQEFAIGHDHSDDRWRWNGQPDDILQQWLVLWQGNMTVNGRTFVKATPLGERPQFRFTPILLPSILP